MKRCEWAPLNDNLYIEYHDEEWGVPVHDDRKLFEFLILEGAQAGLSWKTILYKRENYRKAFDNFNPEYICNYDANKINELLNNAGIIRNKLKINSAIKNSRFFIEIIEKYDSFNNYIWSFTDNRVITNTFKTLSEIPTETELSRKISKDLKQRGFSFVGPTIIYSFMQAIGIVNDHIVDCFRYQEIIDRYGK